MREPFLVASCFLIVARGASGYIFNPIQPSFNNVVTAEIIFSLIPPQLPECLNSIATDKFNVSFHRCRSLYAALNSCYDTMMCRRKGNLKTVIFKIPFFLRFDLLLMCIHEHFLVPFPLFPPI